MSRQFDEYMTNRFELFGEEYELIEPTDLETLVESYRILELLQQGIDSNEPDSGHPFYHLYRTQEELISEYVVDQGEFDSTLLVRNISYLAKKNGIGIGDLEKILGISTGYISRTAKATSGKRMSIDNVWRIARLFDVDLRLLIETDLSIPNKNTDLVAQFLNKIREQTQENKIIWDNNGGHCVHIAKRLETVSMLQEDEIGYLYKPEHLAETVKFYLADDIFVCKDIDQKKELVMIPYARADKETDVHFDFYFIDQGMVKLENRDFEKAFYTLEDITGTLDTYAKMLNDAVISQALDAVVPFEVQSLIKDYLSNN